MSLEWHPLQQQEPKGSPLAHTAHPGESRDSALTCQLHGTPDLGTGTSACPISEPSPVILWAVGILAVRPSVWVQTAMIHSSAAGGDLLPCQKLSANTTSCGVSILRARACVLICPGLIPTPWACAPRTKVINDSRSIWGWGVTHLWVLGAQIGDMLTR